VIEELQGIAPVLAVSGNHEPELIDGILPDPSYIELAGHNVLLTHRFVFMEWNVFKETLARFIWMADPLPRIVIFGHLHLAVNEEFQGVYFINPGYAGPDPYEPDPSVGLVEISGDLIRGEIIPVKS
jgi:predicted phosphodiesterase